MGAVEADDARGLLAAMLKSVKAERGKRGGVRVVEDAEDPAFLMQPVLFEPAQVGIVNVSLLCHGRPPP
jgi:succinyl-CoA synthetase beta subunit